MRGALLVVALLLLAGVAAQSGDGQSGDDDVRCPGLVVLVHHPYPDAKDPLGVEWRGTGTDAYYGRYGHLDVEQNGFDFPHTVFDGVVATEGIPDSERPYVSTRDAYHDAFNQRAALGTPAQLDIVASSNGDTVDVTVQVSSPDQAFEASHITLFAAVVEDPVHYAPPPSLSNGVVVHPFVVRAMDARPQTGEGTFGLQFPLDDDWDPAQLLVAVWLQQGPVDGLQFEAHEVVQSGLAVVDGAAHGSCGNSRTVLMEMYSATWCSTCLFGDAVAEEMAADEGILNERVEPRNSYLVATRLAWLWGALALTAGVAIAWVKLPGAKQ